MGAQTGALAARKGALGSTEARTVRLGGGVPAPFSGDGRIGGTLCAPPDTADKTLMARGARQAAGVSAGSDGQQRGTAVGYLGTGSDVRGTRAVVT